MSATPTNSAATPAERTAWLIVATGLVVFFVALVTYGNAGEPAAATMWMVAGSALAFAAMIPALLLTGLRQLVSIRAELRSGEDRREGTGLNLT